MLAESDKKADRIPRFDFSNLKAFNEILEDEKASQIDNKKWKISKIIKPD